MPPLTLKFRCRLRVERGLKYQLGNDIQATAGMSLARRAWIEIYAIIGVTTKSNGCRLRVERGLKFSWTACQGR